MTVAYLDCEFNGYKGDLISLALVIDDNNYFYEVLGCPNPVPWVAENVMPILNKEPIAHTTSNRNLKLSLLNIKIW